MIDEIHLAETLTADMMPIVKVLLAGIVAIWIKDFITSVSKGIAFYMNRAFGEGDRVKIDDADVIKSFIHTATIPATSTFTIGIISAVNVSAKCISSIILSLSR